MDNYIDRLPIELQRMIYLDCGYGGYFKYLSIFPNTTKVLTKDEIDNFSERRKQLEHEAKIQTLKTICETGQLRKVVDEIRDSIFYKTMGTNRHLPPNSHRYRDKFSRLLNSCNTCTLPLYYHVGYNIYYRKCIVRNSYDDTIAFNICDGCPLPDM